MGTNATYEIQQDNANCYRVIRIFNGQRRAWDCPPCKSQAEARRVISELVTDQKE